MIDDATIPHYVSASDCLLEVVRKLMNLGLTIGRITQDLNNNLRHVPISTFDPTVLHIFGTMDSTAEITYSGEAQFNPLELCRDIKYGGVAMIVTCCETTATVDPVTGHRPATVDGGSFTVQFVVAG